MIPNKSKSENRPRAKRILKALRTQYSDLPADLKDIITDALTDLRHLCDTKGIDFADRDRLAYQHYSDEVALAN